MNIKAPLLICLGLVLLGMGLLRGRRLRRRCSRSRRSSRRADRRQASSGRYFILSLTANVGFWATLSLNIPDFSRYARSQRDQVLGQALGLPTTMGLYSFIGVAVTSAAFVIYKDLPAINSEALGSDVLADASSRIRSCLIVAMVALCIATLATNIAANVVSPANDFAHLWPRRISFRIGGFITGIIGILIQPWQLVANATVYIDQVAGRLFAAAWARSAAC